MSPRIFLFILSCIFLSGCSVFSKRAKTGLQVMTSDIPSSIFINNQFIEKAPMIEKTLPPGEYSLRIVPDNTSFVAFETSIVLREGLLTVITWKPSVTLEQSGGVIYEMEPLASKEESELSFLTQPEGAIIKLDDTEKEFSPKIYSSITPGNHTFEITLPSYETQQHTINAVAGYRMIIKATLAKLSSIDTETSIPSPTPATSSAATSSAITKSASPSAQVKPPYVTILKTDYFIDGEEVLKVRERADATSFEIGRVIVGGKYSYLRQDEDWYQIEFEKNRGWISKRYADLTEE